MNARTRSMDASSMHRSSLKMVRRWAACLLAAVLCVGVVSGTAWAEDTLPGLQADYKALKKSKDGHHVARFAGRAAVLYERIVDKNQQKLLIGMVSKLPSINKSDKVILAALDAMAEMGDARGAKFIKKYLRLRGKAPASETLKRAIRCAAKLPDGSLVRPLLTLFDKSKQIGVKRMAIEALSHYGQLKRYRAKILDTLVSEIKKVKPGGPGRMSGGGGGGLGGDLDSGSGGYGEDGGPGAVWTALSAVMPRVLNRLTGQSVSSMDQWFGLHNHNKRKLSELFTDDS